MSARTSCDPILECHERVFLRWISLVLPDYVSSLPDPPLSVCHAASGELLVELLSALRGRTPPLKLSRNLLLPRDSSSAQLNLHLLRLIWPDSQLTQALVLRIIQAEREPVLSLLSKMACCELIQPSLRALLPPDAELPSSADWHKEFLLQWLARRCAPFGVQVDVTHADATFDAEHLLWALLESTSPAPPPPYTSFQSSGQRMRHILAHFSESLGVPPLVDPEDLVEGAEMEASAFLLYLFYLHATLSGMPLYAGTEQEDSDETVDLHFSLRGSALQHAVAGVLNSFDVVITPQASNCTFTIGSKLSVLIVEDSTKKSVPFQLLLHDDQRGMTVQYTPLPSSTALIITVSFSGIPVAEIPVKITSSESTNNPSAPSFSPSASSASSSTLPKNAEDPTVVLLEGDIFGSAVLNSLVQFTIRMVHGDSQQNPEPEPIQAEALTLVVEHSDQSVPIQIDRSDPLCFRASFLPATAGEYCVIVFYKSTQKAIQVVHVREKGSHIAPPGLSSSGGFSEPPASSSLVLSLSDEFVGQVGEKSRLLLHVSDPSGIPVEPDARLLNLSLLGPNGTHCAFDTQCYLGGLSVIFTPLVDGFYELKAFNGDTETVFPPMFVRMKAQFSGIKKVFVGRKTRISLSFPPEVTSHSTSDITFSVNGPSGFVPFLMIDPQHIEFIPPVPGLYEICLFADGRSHQLQPVLAIAAPVEPCPPDPRFLPSATRLAVASSPSSQAPPTVDAFTLIDNLVRDIGVPTQHILTQLEEARLSLKAQELRITLTDFLQSVNAIRSICEADPSSPEDFFQAKRSLLAFFPLLVHSLSQISQDLADTAPSFFSDDLTNSFDQLRRALLLASADLQLLRFPSAVLSPPISPRTSEHSNPRLSRRRTKIPQPYPDEPVSEPTIQTPRSPPTKRPGRFLPPYPDQSTTTPSTPSTPPSTLPSTPVSTLLETPIPSPTPVEDHPEPQEPSQISDERTVPVGKLTSFVVTLRNRQQPMESDTFVELHGPHGSFSPGSVAFTSSGIRVEFTPPSPGVYTTVITSGSKLYKLAPLRAVSDSSPREFPVNRVCNLVFQVKTQSGSVINPSTAMARATIIDPTEHKIPATLTLNSAGICRITFTPHVVGIHQIKCMVANRAYTLPSVLVKESGWKASQTSTSHRPRNASILSNARERATTHNLPVHSTEDIDMQAMPPMPTSASFSIPPPAPPSRGDAGISPPVSPSLSPTLSPTMSPTLVSPLISPLVSPQVSPPVSPPTSPPRSPPTARASASAHASSHGRPVSHRFEAINAVQTLTEPSTYTLKVYMGEDPLSTLLNISNTYRSYTITPRTTTQELYRQILDALLKGQGPERSKLIKELIGAEGYTLVMMPQSSSSREPRRLQRFELAMDAIRAERQLEEQIAALSLATGVPMTQTEKKLIRKIHAQSGMIKTLDPKFLDTQLSRLVVSGMRVRGLPASAFGHSELYCTGLCNAQKYSSAKRSVGNLQWDESFVFGANALVGLSFLWTLRDGSFGPRDPRGVVAVLEVPISQLSVMPVWQNWFPVLARGGGDVSIFLKMEYISEIAGTSFAKRPQLARPMPSKQARSYMTCQPHRLFLVPRAAKDIRCEVSCPIIKVDFHMQKLKTLPPKRMGREPAWADRLEFGYSRLPPESPINVALWDGRTKVGCCTLAFGSFAENTESTAWYELYAPNSPPTDRAVARLQLIIENRKVGPWLTQAGQSKLYFCPAPPSFLIISCMYPRLRLTLGEKLTVLVRVKDQKLCKMPTNDLHGGELEAYVEQPNGQVICLAAHQHYPDPQVGLFHIDIQPTACGVHQACVFFNGQRVQHTVANLKVKASRSNFSLSFG